MEAKVDKVTGKDLSTNDFTNEHKNKLDNVISNTVELTSTIQANTNYTIPLKYHVGTNELNIFYCGEKLKKGTDYIEVGEAGEISNTIQFTEDLGNLDMSGVEGFEDFIETLEFVVRGNYNEQSE